MSEEKMKESVSKEIGKEKKKWDIDFNDWRNTPSYGSPFVFGGFDKKTKTILKQTPVKIFYMKEVNTKFGPKAVAYAELEDETKVTLWLPVEINKLWQEKRNELKGKLTVLDKKVSISYGMRLA
jgi:menaquinone-dependent protoporphyrinogen IX oxidase